MSNKIYQVDKQLEVVKSMFNDVLLDAKTDTKQKYIHIETLETVAKLITVNRYKVPEFGVQSSEVLIDAEIIELVEVDTPDTIEMLKTLLPDDVFVNMIEMFINICWDIAEGLTTLENIVNGDWLSKSPNLNTIHPYGFI